MVLGLDKGVEHALFDAARATSETVGRVTAKGFSKEAFSQAVDEVKKLQFLFKSGRISANTMASRIGQVVDGFKEIAKAGLRTNADGVLEYASKVVVKETPEVIDNAAAKTVATYFGHNPKAVKRLIESYAEKLEKAIRIMDKINKGQTLAGKIPVAGKIFNWFRKMRLEHLAKMRIKFAGLKKAWRTGVVRARTWTSLFCIIWMI